MNAPWVVNKGANEVTVSWDEPSNEYMITKYRIEYKKIFNVRCNKHSQMNSLIIIVVVVIGRACPHGCSEMRYQMGHSKQLLQAYKETLYICYE